MQLDNLFLFLLGVCLGKGLLGFISPLVHLVDIHANPDGKGLQCLDLLLQIPSLHHDHGGQLINSLVKQNNVNKKEEEKRKAIKILTEKKKTFNLLASRLMASAQAQSQPELGRGPHSH